MDPAQLLDILGNENRRKIIDLLSIRPCYVSEISGRLGVGPKAIINHLDMLEKAGLVQCSIDSQRRKYFNIIDNVRLVVSVSPYSFTLSIQDVPDLDPDEDADSDLNSDLLLDTGQSEAHDPDDITNEGDMVENFRELYEKIIITKEKGRELSIMQQQLQARYTNLMDQCVCIIEEICENGIEAEII